MTRSPDRRDVLCQCSVVEDDGPRDREDTGGTQEPRLVNPPGHGEGRYHVCSELDGAVQSDGVGEVIAGGRPRRA